MTIRGVSPAVSTELGGIMSSFQMRVLDTELCTAAVQYARTVSDPFLFHHVMRSAFFADFIGRERGVKYDRELLWVSAVLHDLGLTRIAPVEARFEIEGADLAKEFLAKKGMSDRHVEIVWDAIALHTTAEIPSRKCAEIALCQLGIAVDLGIAPPDIVSHEMVDEVLAAYWLDTHELLLMTLVGLYQQNPKAAASNAVAEVCERRVPGFQRPNLCDRVIDRSAHGVGTGRRTS
jgi:HD domain-containing protein